ncbi:MAG: thiamine phosphate synthase [Brevinema sp.]
MFYRFMLITQKNQSNDKDYFDFIKKCADGGITSLQLREKHLNQEELTILGSQLLRILEEYRIPLIINDSAELAQKIGTPYIHIGQKDDTVNQSLSLIPNAQIGISIASTKQLTLANQQSSIAYVTASAVFPSTNKQNLNTIWGLAGLSQLSQISKHPLTAIGGITLENTEDIIKHGAQGIALIGALHDSSDPYTLCKRFRNLLDQTIKESDK